MVVLFAHIFYSLVSSIADFMLLLDDSSYCFHSLTIMMLHSFMCKRFCLFCSRHLLVLEVLCVALPSLSRYSNGEECGAIGRLPNKMLLKLRRVVMHHKTEWMEMANTADKFIQSSPKYGNEAIILMSRVTQLCSNLCKYYSIYLWYSFLIGCFRLILVKSCQNQMYKTAHLVKQLQSRYDSLCRHEKERNII